MILLDKLYKINSDSVVEDGHLYSIRLNPESFIYKAHFPGEPVTPGVCIIQIAQELLARHYGLGLNITTVKNVKFLGIISPLENQTVNYLIQKASIEEKRVKCQVSVYRDENVFAKISIICTVVE